MTKKEQALSLLAIAQDGSRTMTERWAAKAELLELKKGAKCAWNKLGTDEATIAQLEEDLDKDVNGNDIGIEAAEPLSDPLEEAVAPKPKPKGGAERGLITALTKKLLLADDAPYADIVAEVKRQFPEATTTNRSVATVASDMRTAGEKVASRRTAAKEKA